MCFFKKQKIDKPLASQNFKWDSTQVKSIQLKELYVRIIKDSDSKRILCTTLFQYKLLKFSFISSRKPE